MRKMNEEAIKKIAATYGYDAQSRQLIEEMAELIVAINKLHRLGKNWNNQDNVWCERMKNITEEIADVTIMIEQMKYLLQISETDIEQIIEHKLNRQLERINNGLE